MLGIRPELGRLFTPEEDADGRNHEVILTHRLWGQDFHSDPSVIGKTIELNDAQFTVVGVLPAFLAKYAFRCPAHRSGNFCGGRLRINSCGLSGHLYSRAPGDQGGPDGGDSL